MSAWLLPESVADVLPAEARRIEELRRQMLDRFRVYGYELVMPPMLEYTESLLAKADQSLDLQTFKLLDQASGRMLGLRADTTPQVARIDAHILNRQGVTRLCYCGPVLHTQARGLHNTREPLQCGAELYGCSGLEADLEILTLAVDTLGLASVKQACLALSHAGLLNAVLSTISPDASIVRQLHAALAQKDQVLLETLLIDFPVDVSQPVLALMDLYGPVTGQADCVLNRAKVALPKTDAVVAVLVQLEDLVVRLLEIVKPGPRFMLDLADVAGFEYHSGIVFAAYVEGCPNAVLRGGRYDDVGAVYGRARPATGFSVDLRELVSLQGTQLVVKTAIRAPWGHDLELLTVIRGLRDQGEVVVQSLPTMAQEIEEFVCDRELVQTPQGWQVRSVNADQESKS